jgi:hypothetical protein
MTTLCWYVGIAGAVAAAALQYFGLGELADLVMIVAATLCGGALGAGLAGRKH